MARRKKGSSRKRPLVFTESPVEASRHYPSPVFSARNPIGADVVSVKEKQQSWVSIHDIHFRHFTMVFRPFFNNLD